MFEYSKHSFGCIHASVLPLTILEKASRQNLDPFLVMGSADNNSKVENLRGLFSCFDVGGNTFFS